MLTGEGERAGEEPDHTKERKPGPLSIIQYSPVHAVQNLLIESASSKTARKSCFTIVFRVPVPLNELCRRLWGNKLEDPAEPDSGMGTRLPHTHEGENHYEEY